MISRRRFPVLATTILFAFSAGCSDDEETPVTPEAGVDAATSDAGSDSTAPDAQAEAEADVSTTSDAGADVVASDSSTRDGSETSTGDAGALTPLQKRGQYLVDHVIACGDCHTPQGPMGPDMTKYLAGNANFVAIPGADGGVNRLASRNLTNDPTGLSNRTDAEIKAMILDGKRPTATGQEPLNPIMPYYVFHNMHPEDADAIVAYLRTVPGINNDLPRRSPMFDVPAAATPIDPETIPLPDNSYPSKESALRGRYLTAEIGLCVECHTKHVQAPLPIDATKMFAGGEDFSAFFASTLMIHPVSKNLTSDVTTGLGAWTVEDVVNAVTKGKAKDGSGICPPMPFGPMGAYGGLTPQDATDIANYIKSLPAISNLVPDMCVFPPVAPADAGMDASGSDGASEATAPDSAADSAAEATTAADSAAD
jgi:hypothetical protein